MEEIKLLNDIGRKRDETMKIAEDENNEKLLVKLGEPVKWIGYNSNDSFMKRILHILSAEQLSFYSDFHQNRYQV